MTLFLFNTETRQKEQFKPTHENQVTLYTCGPTVYDFAHIGNFRTYVFEDLLKRTLIFFGYNVHHVMNITDIDDKTIKGATTKNISLKEFTEPFTRAFFQDKESLNLIPADDYPAATEYITQMIEMIQGLIEKGFAYVGSDKSVYYAIKEFTRYGCLSHLKQEDLKSGASERVASDEYDKEHIADFVLWKAYDRKRDGSIYWDSPWGKGRPGWHLECSTMAMQLLGKTIDIHVGGVDNMFPHHENEIAQSEAYSGERFANLWMHSEHLLVENKKMSKRYNNFYTFRDLINKGYRPDQIRYMLLHTHYKTQLNFTFSGLNGAKASLKRINDFIVRLQNIEMEISDNQVQKYLLIADDAFTKSLADDLNISAALAALFDLIREINILCDENRVRQSEAEEVLDLLKKFDTVLGVMSFQSQEEPIPAYVQKLFKKRQTAREEKKWTLADQFRNEIQAEGYVIEDSASGSRLKKI